MRERRIQPRYDVMGLGEVQGRTLRDVAEERLVSLSRGGCGFTSSAEKFPYKVGDRVTCRFEWGQGTLDSVDLEGHILYVIPHPINDRVGRFYGVGFLASEAQKMNALIEMVEKLFKKGRVSMA